MTSLTDTTHQVSTATVLVNVPEDQQSTWQLGYKAGFERGQLQGYYEGKIEALMNNISYKQGFNDGFTQGRVSEQGATTQKDNVQDLGAALTVLLQAGVLCLHTSNINAPVLTALAGMQEADRTDEFPIGPNVVVMPVTSQADAFATTSFPPAGRQQVAGPDAVSGSEDDDMGEAADGNESDINVGTGYQSAGPSAGADATRVTLEQLQSVFNLPVEEAAKELRVCVTVLKRNCRQYGIPRWPHRKLLSVEKCISMLEKKNDPTREAELESFRLFRDKFFLEPNLELDKDLTRVRNELLKGQLRLKRKHDGT